MPPNSHAHHQFPPVVIQRAVWLPRGRGPAGRTQPGGVLGDDPALGAGVGSGGPAAPAETEPALARRRNGGAHRRQEDASVAGGGRRRRDAGRPGAAPAGQGRHPQAPREARLGVPLQRLPRVAEGRGRQQVSATSPGARAAPAASAAGLRSRPRMPGTTSLAGGRGGRGGRGYSTLRRRGPDYERFRSGPAPLRVSATLSAERDSAGAGPTAMLIHVNSGMKGD